MKNVSNASDVDHYVSLCDEPTQKILKQVRETIRSAAPDATELISYQMPAFKGHGILVYYAVWKNHLGLYPPIKGDPAIEKAVARYAGPKGNLQFPLAEPLPLKLLTRIVKLRVTQDQAKADAKRKPSASKAKTGSSAKSAPPKSPTKVRAKRSLSKKSAKPSSPKAKR